VTGTLLPAAPGSSPAKVSVRRRPADPSAPISYVALSEDGEGTVPSSRHDEGYAAGYAEGAAAARAEADEVAHRETRRTAQALHALEQAAEAARRAGLDAQHQLEASLGGFAFALVETLFGRELALSSDPGREAIERALAMDDTDAPVRARLHPDDVEVLGVLGEPARTRAVTVVADPSVEAGGALVDVGEATIDSTLSRALERVRRVLVEEAPRSGA
jgi:flagellar assembly protein FliH